MARESRQRPPAAAAKEQAQRLAFAPFAFFAAITLRDTGVLATLERAGPGGLDADAVAAATGLSTYGVSVLLDFAVDVGLVRGLEHGFVLAPLGYVLLYDEMTRVNMDFTRDFALRGLPALETSVREGRPAGLQALGPWPNLYDGLAELDEATADSWFRFDQFYSDRVFDDLVARIFARPVRHLVDVGGNTGRLAMRCLQHDPTVEVTIVDLPGQLAMAAEQLQAAGLRERVHLHEADLLDPGSSLPEGADALVMSQFLACFTPAEMLDLLGRARAAMTADSRLYIAELFPDRQREPAARYSLNAVSLYFTCMVNGNSRFYRRADLVRQVEAAGLEIESEVEEAGVGHSVLCCRRVAPEAGAATAAAIGKRDGSA